MRLSVTIRAAALLEAAKGVLVLAAGMSVLSYIHDDAQRIAERLVGHLHLNPASGFPRIFIEYAAKLSDVRLATLAALAAGYASARLIEAYGLWRERRWAEWFAAVSGGIYMPFEIYEMFRGDTWLSLGALSVNIVIVAFMIYALYRGRSGSVRQT